MPRLIIQFIEWPETQRVVCTDVDMYVKDFAEATRCLELDLQATSDPTFSAHVMKKWHDNKGTVVHQNGNSNRGFKFIFLEREYN